MTVKVVLTFTTGSLKGQKREFTRPANCVIGRSGDCDVHLPATLEFMGVSRRHCVLDIDPPAVQVRDLGSRNGTFLNGENIGQRRGKPGSTEESPWHSLKEGDELRVGATTIRVGPLVAPGPELVTEAAVGPGLCPLPPVGLASDGP
jgi:pSer/pThr/pTyr-binding forkhead associated (FHA) protein